MLLSSPAYVPHLQVHLCPNTVGMQYAHTTFTNVTLAAALIPARDTHVPRLNTLPSSYLTSTNASTRARAFYGSSGTFTNAALAFDEANKDTATTGEVLSSMPMPAPAFRGDVLTINGDQDIIFCAPTPPACGNLALEGQFYLAARSVESGGYYNDLNCIFL